MIMQSNSIEVRVDGPVATVTINRQQKRNALTRAMIEDLRVALSDVHQERRVRVMVLTGAGAAFCAGRDVEEMAAGGPDPAADMVRWGEEAEQLRDLVLEMLQLPKPIIAAVNGPAVGAGAGLVLAADIAIASPEATFGFPEPRLGVVAGVESPLLAFRLGAGPASRLLLSSQQIPADEALRIGVYHETVDTPLLWARAVELAKECAAGAPESVQLTKRLLLETVGEQLVTQLSSGAIATATARTTEAAQQGLEAFLEKREPEWP
ncbi:1,4-Dihydroxy-2-naphthoyl-CoA synthase [Posidoniimonas corsicana]|uniref:1,4-Dihydroxy-2-naphthoyl-CoA synthase n=1 Tax=Posidoniimonas corsicana TaxID=1938618 RepID=A0A5C5VIY1_9BACT|nr:enoyl-CoA hydratase/isomerase family protein [Posidoniimonas corsicana]TWT37755.1 1,4-Dihydroxy-2-naphthoyl-CoA synthase [Posidoniimonas corsicana]